MKKLLEEIFSLYYKDVYRYLFSLCHDATLAEDLCSEVFLEAVRSIAGFRFESDIRTWLYTIARRRWFQYLKWKNRQIVSAPLEDLSVPSEENVEDTLYRKDAAACIEQMLNEEPERNCRIFQLRLEGYSFYEIGTQLGISENSARVIHFRLRAKLRNLLMERGYDSDTIQL